MFEQKTIAETAEFLNTDRKNGLSRQEAAARLKKYGPNELSQEKAKSYPVMFLEQLNDPLIYILMAAAIISAVLGELSDTVIIISVVLINAFVGIIQEGKAQKAMEALKKLTSPSALVKRDGNISEINASELVVGDIVCLEAGRQVPADLRLTESLSLKIEEASLTGESIPSEKDALFTSTKNIAAGDRINMAFMSTNVVYGRGEGIVTATGMQTEIGKIAGSISKTQNEPTPLQRRLGDLGRLLSILAVILCAALFVIAILQKRDVLEMLLTAISLAVAAVPEGLPAVVTIVLALSVSRMVKINTIIRKLPSVETLGCVNIVCSDKTGTLTQNRMSVVKCYTDNSLFMLNEFPYKKHRLFIDGFILCNDAATTPAITSDAEITAADINSSFKTAANTLIGDPTETALIDMGNTFNISKKSLETRYPRIGEIPFDSDRKCMSTLHRNHSSTIQYTKGSIEKLLKLCTHLHINGEDIPLTEERRRSIENAAAKISAEEALRTLGIAYKANISSPNEAGLTFLGFVGMTDPIRPEAKLSLIHI